MKLINDGITIRVDMANANSSVCNNGSIYNHGFTRRMVLLLILRVSALNDYRKQTGEEVGINFTSNFMIKEQLLSVSIGTF